MSGIHWAIPLDVKKRLATRILSFSNLIICSSDKPGKVIIAHNTMEKPRITVPAFLIYCQVLSQVWINRPRIVGARYGGSSITNGVLGPFNMVERINLAANRAKVQDRIVRRNSIRARFPGKKAPIITAYTGSLAPQFMNGTTSNVAIRSFLSRRVLVAITPGTAHPPDMPPLTIRAITEFPCNPNHLRTLSSMYATRAM